MGFTSILYYLRVAHTKIQRIASIVIVIVVIVTIYSWDFTSTDSDSTDVAKVSSLLNPLEFRNKSILIMGDYPIVYESDDSNAIEKLNCSVKHCFISKYSETLNQHNMTLHDALVFTDKSISCEQTKKFENRSSSVMFTYLSSKSPDKAPVCEPCLDDFFNWTFTRRLDSDIVWTDFVVRNSTNDIIAPALVVQWEAIDAPIEPEILDFLAKKNKTAAWYITNCKSSSHRDEYFKALQDHLFHYGVQIDVFGPCGNKLCPDDDSCDSVIKRDYVFYLAFEDGYAEDYVTNIVLRAYDNYAVPIVFGGANYSRFLPLGSYIYAHDYDPYNLAALMHETVKNKTKLSEYFKWTNLYKIEPSLQTDAHPLCRLCASLHNDEKVTQAPAKQNFRTWFNGLQGMMWCLSPSFWNEVSNVTVQ